MLSRRRTQMGKAAWVGAGLTAGACCAELAPTLLTFVLSQRDQRDKRRRVDEALCNAGAVHMVYQPIIDLDRGQIVGMEALARFTDGRPPDVWFPEADDVGLGSELERLALHLALERVPSNAYLSVNISPATLTQRATVDLLVFHRNVGDRLVLELTEHA